MNRPFVGNSSRSARTWSVYMWLSRRPAIKRCAFGSPCATSEKGLHEAICILLDAMPAKAKKKKLVLEPKPSAGDCAIAGRTIMYAR